MNPTPLSTRSLHRILTPATPREERIAILKAIAQALDQAHAQGRVHGDLSPGHIQITDQHLDITGFHTGADQLYDAVPSSPDEARYFSPERILGLPISPASDQFSLAAITCEVLLGAPPFTGADVHHIFHRICTEPPAFPVGLNSGVADALTRALSKVPADRFPSAGEFIDAVTSRLQKAPPAVPQPVVRPRADIAPELPSPIAERQRRRMDLLDGEKAQTRPGRSWSRPIVITAVCALAAVLLLALSMYRSAPEIPQQTLDTRSAPISPPPTAQPALPQSKTTTTTPDRLPSTPVETQHVRDRSASPARRLTQTNVMIGGQPMGAKVRVDGSQQCALPCTLPLAPGRHTFTAEMSGFREQKGIFHVPDDRSLTISLPQSSGTLILTSNPPGALISIDGAPHGRTPADLHLSPGNHTVAVSYAGQTQRAQVAVSADAIQAKSFVF